eukprot:TRINITY_DN40207_c0_g1_i1.p1 TRINITY_DN40207_c0_g1~~TRINITY_DN40207_c0_g1_i1.p1  ORF type:complete len:121 (-),score=14.08 TRINITY_DN40207_c0_g1_i1:36-398(-)
MIVDSLFWKKQTKKFVNRIINYFRQNTKRKLLTISVLLFIAFICLKVFYRNAQNLDNFNSLDFSEVSDDLKNQHEKLINNFLENNDEKYGKLAQKFPEKRSEEHTLNSSHEIPSRMPSSA